MLHEEWSLRTNKLLDNTYFLCNNVSAASCLNKEYKGVRSFTTRALNPLEHGYHSDEHVVSRHRHLKATNTLPSAYRWKMLQGWLLALGTYPVNAS